MDAKVLERIELLRPDSQTELEARFTALRWMDGSSTVLTTWPVDTDLQWSEVEYEVDLARGVYSTAITRRPEPIIGDGRGDGDTLSNRAAAFTSGGGWSLYAKIDTLDPIDIVVARTDLFLDWSDCPTNEEILGDNLDVLGWVPRCFANEWTAANTSWHLISCSPLLDNDGSSLFASSRGSYYNDDFGSIYLRTWAHSAVDVNIFSLTSPLVTSAHSTSGEFSYLLRGRLSKDGPHAIFGFQCPSEPSTGGGGGGETGGGETGGGETGGGETGGGGETCVPVYDGETGEYIQDCCGETTSQIVECAGGLL